MNDITYVLDSPRVEGFLEEMGWSQAEGARQFGLHRQHFHRLLKQQHEPQKKTLRRIANVMEIKNEQELLVEED